MQLIEFRCGRLDGLNEYTRANRSNAMAGASTKKKNQKVVMLGLLQAGLLHYKLRTPVRIVYRWIETTKRRDKDNIAFAKKFIQDTLVKFGLLCNDGWGEIESYTDYFEIGVESGVIVTIYEEGDRNGED